MQQYEAHEAAQHRQRPGTRGRPPYENQYHHTLEEQNMDMNGASGSGLIIIDDDENPGLRGNVPLSLYSARHITARHTGDTTRVVTEENDFPSLAATVPIESVSTTVPSVPSVKKVLPKTKTLSKISKMVQQTDPEDQHRQWEAREVARRKAMLANLTFGAEPTTMMIPTGSSTSYDHPWVGDTFLSPIAANVPTEAQLERNRAFAEALGVEPATVRAKLHMGGWMRPTQGTVEVDEFGNELNTTVYPDALIKQAKELRLDIVLKLEKKWLTFLGNDQAASLPLHPMERSVRAFVHEYAEYWRLHTESFDPEPKRYIHCVKLRDTSAPHPLISSAMRHWQPSRPTISHSLDHSTLQTAGQSTISEREFSSGGPSRVPLSLKPRSATTQDTIVTWGTSVGVSIGGTPSRLMEEYDTTTMMSGRFSSLHDGRERPKLELKKRTLPLSLPPLELSQNVVDTVSEAHDRQMDRNVAKSRKEQELAERKQRALQLAFASDDEHNSESEWEEKVAVYMESDEEF
jgi:R3H domain